jgi:uncharacterized membrane protein YqiK
MQMGLILAGVFDGLPTWLIGVLILVVAVAVLGGIAMLVMKFYRKVDQGRALIINNTNSEPMVTFTGGIVYPIIHRAEIMDISVKTIEIDRRGKEGLICQDNIRADIKVAFFVRVNKTKEDVLKVAQAIGCQRASHPETLEQLFVAKFSEALKTVGKRLDFESLYTKRDEFKDQIIEVIGKDLNGYALEDAAIDYLEQTALSELDPSNILDARGIKKITSITAEQSVLTNDLKQNQIKAIKKQDVEAAEAIFALERQEADAKAKQLREIATIQAREQALTLSVQSEEKRKYELARIKSEEDVQISDENKMRQVEVAQKNRERVVKVETERVEKDRALEQVIREREVELSQIDKEKALEHERKAIADVIAARIAVEKSVAEEEERIKDLRVIADAKRKKEAVVIGAEAAAQEKLVLSIKEAEAQEQVAHHKAKETVTLADAELEASDRTARAKIRLAEGVQAETAAPGLAKAKVKEADAAANEKLGLAEVRVKEADAGAVEKQGAAQAESTKLMGLAGVNIKEADAAAVEKQGAAEAVAIKLKMEAEAKGLAEKLAAMATMDVKSRQHEEFRIRLEKDQKVELEELEARKAIAAEQATVMGKAMESAKINLVGGDGQFLTKFFDAVSLGQSIDGAIDNSESLQTALKDYIDGDASVREDVKDVLTAEGGLDAESLKNLSIAAALNKLADSAGGDKKAALESLMAKARELGL